VLGDRGATELLVDDDVAALRPQRGLYGRRHDVDAPEQCRPGVLVKLELLWHGSRASFLLENGEDVVLAHDQILLVVDLHLGAGVLPEQDLVPGLHIERDLLAFVGDLAVTDGDHLGLLGLLLGRVRDDDPALLDLFLLEPLHQKPIVQRTNLHTLLLLRWTSPGSYSVTRSRLDLVTRDARFTFLGVRPDLPLGHEHDDCHEEGDDHRGEEPPARGDVQGDPAPRDAPENTEQQIPGQAVPSILHHDPGQPASQQPYDHPRDAHCELHDPSSFFGGEERWPPPLLLPSRLTSSQYHHINYMSSRIYITQSTMSRAGREVGGRRAVTALGRCSMRNVTRALVGALVASLVAAAVSVSAQTPTAAD